MENTLCVAFITYNRSRELVSAVESILPQLDSGDEIVIVDNGSDDRHKELLSEYIERWSKKCRVKSTFLNTNTGVSAGRNVAWKMASSDLTLFLDDDCIVKQESLVERIRKYCLEHPMVAILTIPVNTYGKFLGGYIHSVKDKLGNTCVSTFNGGAHVICRKNCPFDKLYPDSLFWGYEEHFLATKVWCGGYEIHRLEGSEVQHCPKESSAGKVHKGKIRNENLLAGSFVVHHLLLPFALRTVYDFLFLGRLVKYTFVSGVSVKRIVKLVKNRYKREDRCIQSYRSLKNMTSRFGLFSIF